MAANGGWQIKNVDDKIRMTNYGWKIANDTMQTIKSLWGKINLRCFLTVLFVNKPSHLIEFRPREVQLIFYNQLQNRSKHFKAGRIQNKPISLDRIITDSTFIVRLRSSFTTSKKDFRCLLLGKFPMQETGIVKLSEATLQLSNRALFPCLPWYWLHLNTRRAGRIRDS